MIAILDYGMGNLGSVHKALSHLGASAVVTSDPDVANAAQALVLPGVGAMRSAMVNMRARGLDRTVRDAIEAGKPFLGICLGMQMLFERSEEDDADGLGILPGRVRRIPAAAGIKIPHMGWNRITLRGAEAAGGPGALLREGESVYFVHSFHAVPDDPSILTAMSDHGIMFAAAVRSGSVDAFQFHPEKSGDRGIEILRRWLTRMEGTTR
ncbi:MAG: imidazole glycerol phosphate synthase subunit HisH [Clostridiaceae bacterium]|jgi:glutamine amidotransferase|nr:imidazole glycerol phosphate synthase subunit HisH [Clostridiaceae bacterium]